MKYIDAGDGRFQVDDLVVISAENGNADLRLIGEGEAAANGEALLQLVEGASYQFKILKGDSIAEEIPGIVAVSKLDKKLGRITPGNHVGRLELKITSGVAFQTIPLEVRSVKADYRTDYRHMLQDIASECAELVMYSGVALAQGFKLNGEDEAKALYRNFSLVQALAGSEKFARAVERILAHPASRPNDMQGERDIRRAGRFGRRELVQVASRQDRMPFDGFAASLPRRITVRERGDTLDIPENRFVKHVLEVLLLTAEKTMEAAGKELSRTKLKEEAQALADKFSGWLRHGFFRELSPPGMIPYGSTVLQRREGYREVLKVWSLHRFSGALSWEFLEDSYQAGKRDAAELYEYWLFFRLYKLVQELKWIGKEGIQQLVELTNNGLDLKLERGKKMDFVGFVEHKSRRINTRFTYNQTFNGKAKFPDAGSWSVTLRPDYTISLWPGGFSPEEAERQELMVHLHFDAKYKVGNIEELLKDEEIRQGTKVVNADLIKMHGYRDAIRRTAGAYVIFPGEEKLMRQGFHEIVPGLGAFPMRPSENGDGSAALRKFLSEVLDHFADRATQRERMTYSSFKIHKNNPHKEKFYKPYPEYVPEKGEDIERSKPPEDAVVLVCTLAKRTDEEDSKRIRVCIPIGPGIDTRLFQADYVLFFNGARTDGNLQLFREELYSILGPPAIEQESRQSTIFPALVYSLRAEPEEWSKNKMRPVRPPVDKNPDEAFTVSLLSLYSAGSEEEARDREAPVED